MRKKVTLLIFLLFSSVLLGSCSVPVNLRERAIVQAAGIDYEDGRFVLTLQEFVPKNSGGSREEIEMSGVYNKTTGKTLLDALKNAEAKDGNQIFYGQSKLFLIGKSAAQNGMKEILEFMNSNYQLSQNASVLLCEENAEDILHTQLFVGIVPSISIKRIRGCGKAPFVTVIDLLRTCYNLGGNACLPLVRQDGKNSIQIGGCTVFRDYRPILTLTEEETQGLIWLDGDIQDAALLTQLGDQRVSVNIISEKTRLSVEKSAQDELILRVSVSAAGIISEIDFLNGHEVRREQIEQVRKNAEKNIEARIFDAFQKIVTEQRCDLFYLKKRFQNKDPGFFSAFESGAKESDGEAWLSRIRLQTEVRLSIRHSGIQVH